MIKAAIDRILELGNPPIALVNGCSYSNNTDLQPIRDPSPSTVTMHSLKGFSSFYDYGIETGEIDKDSIIHVEHEGSVSLRGPLSGPWRQRDHLCKCQLFQYREFPFGQYLSLENAIVELQSKFERNYQLDNLLAVLSNIKGEMVVTAEDDGSAQSVTVKDSVGRLADLKIKPIVELAPYRTFREVDQPLSKFLLRFKKAQGLPQVALFEADGGAWRHAAIESIAEFLRGKDRVVIA